MKDDYEERLSQKESESISRANELTVEANRQNEENHQQVHVQQEFTVLVHNKNKQYCKNAPGSVIMDRPEMTINFSPYLMLITLLHCLLCFNVQINSQSNLLVCCFSH